MQEVEIFFMEDKGFCIVAYLSVHIFNSNLTKSL